MSENSEAEIYYEKLKDKGSKVRVDDTSDFIVELPPYYDEVKFNKAKEFYSENRFAMFGGMLSGLLGLLSVPSILDLLIETKNSSTPYTAYKRYLATIFHTINWFRYDMKPGTPAWKSITTVRKIHHYSSSKCEKSGVGIISQMDMALTQFAFFGFILERGYYLGIKSTKDDLENFTHFWRVLGYMLGIKDEYNICTDSLETTLPRVKLVRTKVYCHYLEKPKDTFIPMVRAIIDGLWCFNPFLDFDAFVFYTFSIAGVSGYEYSLNEPPSDRVKKMTLYSRWVLWLQYFTHTVLLDFKFLRWYHNFQILYSEFLIKYFPFLAFYYFRSFKKSYVRI